MHALDECARTHTQTHGSNLDWAWCISGVCLASGVGSEEAPPCGGSAGAGPAGYWEVLAQAGRKREAVK